MSYYTLEINVEDLKEKYNWYGVYKWDFAWTEKELYDIKSSTKLCYFKLITTNLVMYIKDGSLNSL